MLTLGKVQKQRDIRGVSHDRGKLVRGKGIRSKSNANNPLVNVNVRPGEVKPVRVERLDLPVVVSGTVGESDVHLAIPDDHVCNSARG